MPSDLSHSGAFPEYQLRSDRFLGLSSLTKSFLAVVGIQRLPKVNLLDTPSRRAKGLVLVFPGIEGHSEINESIVRGLAAAGIPYAIQVQRWCRFSFWNPLHLTMETHNRRMAAQIAELVCAYRRSSPVSPIYLVGHSAGAGMVLFVLEALANRSCKAEPIVETAVLLAAAVSEDFPFETVIPETRTGIWNFSSAFDFIASVLGTLVFGTMDRRHKISIGAAGIRRKCRLRPTVTEPRASSNPVLNEIRYSPRMITAWNLGGHFGCTNSAFVKKHVAPLFEKP
ncbi:MAG: hypothetical protein JNL58_27675 [Planctomyces sp.]|nr:hypothetical protein [Planctomyces sp.]